MTQTPAFALRLPANIRFGRGTTVSAVADISAFGPRLLLVHGRNPARSAALCTALAEAGCSVETLACPNEPTLGMLESALLAIRQRGRPDAVIAFGGGAALDLGKALAALLPSDSAPLDHLEIVGKGQPLRIAPLPCVAIPTTAGTGSEATKNAVISVPDHARKVSLRDDRMVPDLVLIDPALTDWMPKPQTLASGLDAVTQVIEPYLSTRANPFTDALTRPAIAMGLQALAVLMETGEDPEARDALAYVSHVSGIALANAGLGAVHGFAGVLGGETGAAHGVLCARLLPHVLRALEASEAASGETRRRLTEVIDCINATLPGGLSGMSAWMTAQGLPEAPALSPADRRRVAEASQASSSMKPSPVAFSADALDDILAAALG